MADNKTMVAFWLMPAPVARDFFSARVRELAARFDAPVFDPHVTLFGGSIDPDRAVSALRQVRSVRAAYTLEIESVDWSDKYTKTLFVQFKPSAELNALSEEIGAVAGCSERYQFNPHLSLIYKKLEAPEQAQLAASFSIPFEQVEFDRVRVITGRAQTSSREDVEAWRTLDERRLEGSR